MSIELTREPEMMIEDVECPFCKKATLGIIEIPLDEYRTVFRMDCLNVDCILNYRSPSPIELEMKTQELLGMKET